MAKPFYECFDRIERAKLHRDASAQAWNAYIEGYDAFTVRAEVDPSGLGGIWVGQVKPIPSVIAFEIGEFLYQMRATLDHCVYEAACLKSGQRPPPGEEKLEFFLRDSPEKFRDSCWKIATLGEEQRNVIESFQPYKAPQNLEPHELPFNYNRGLSMLNDWARKDRHRKLHVMATWTSNINPMLRRPAGTTLLDFDVPVSQFVLKGESRIATFRVGGWKPGMTIDANPNLAFDLTVNELPLPCHSKDNMNVRFQCIIRAVVEVVAAMAGTFDPKLFE